MAWRLAKSLEKLREQVNAAAPERSKTDDGTIGDEAHSSRTSDHNPNPAGVVCAMDITHDPRHGVDSYKLAEALKASRDPRIKYVISNRRIWNPSVSQEWRAYSGSNPHDRHVHVSVVSNPKLYDDMGEWSAIPGEIGPHVIDRNAKPPRPLMKLGVEDEANVQTLWKLLAAQESKSFGPILEAAVKAFQKRQGLVQDGKVGSYTWGALTGE